MGVENALCIDKEEAVLAALANSAEKAARLQQAEVRTLFKGGTEPGGGWESRMRLHR